jgi:enoyl-CoA hydratase/carnithine racemase
MIELAVDGAVATIVLARPPLNALNPEWVARFGELLDTIESSPDVTVLRIRSGERVFCAGADLAFMTANFGSVEGRASIHAFVTSVQRVFTRLEALPVTSIAQIEGPAVGGGLELALACDFRIIADTASVALPEVNLGLIPGAGGTQRLTRIAGSSVARRLILGGRPVLGAEAVSLRICDWVEPRAEVEAAAAALASRLSAFPRDAMSACRRCIVAAGSADRDGFKEELDATAALLESATTHERVRAFLNRNAARRDAEKG